LIKDPDLALCFLNVHLGMEDAKLVSVENRIVQHLLSVLCPEDVLIQSQLIWNLQILLWIAYMAAKQTLNVPGILMTQQ